MKKLRSDIPIPLYYQLREIIREKILGLEWKCGEEIPSELKLCEEYNLCRATIKQALDGLVNEGLIMRKKGKGSFVTYKKIDNNFLLLPFYKEGIDEYKKETEIIFSGFIECGEYIKKKLDLGEGEKIFNLDRIYFVENKPIILESYSTNSKLAINIEKENLKELSICKFIENSKEIDIMSSQVTISTSLLNDYELKMFDFPTINIGIVVETIFFTNNIPIIFNKKIYKGDNCNLNFEFLFNQNKVEVKSSQTKILE